MSSHAVPAIALLSLLLTVPGLVLGAALGLRREPWLGAAPLLSLACAGIAIPVSTVLGMGWGLAPIALTTLLLSVVGVVCWALARRFAPRIVGVHPEARDRAALGDLLVFGGSIALGMLWVATLLVHIIGDISAVQQSYDGVFHVNAIAHVAQVGKATPDIVASTANTVSAPGFYPPAFHALGALAVRLTGATPVVTANVLAVVISSVVWVPSVALLVHVALARHRFGVLVGSLAAAMFPLFPFMLLNFGVLWPNLLSLAALPAVLALMVTVLGQARTPSIPWLGAMLAGLLSIGGLYYAHPGAIFAAIALGLPVAASALVSVFTVVWRRYRLGPLWVALSIVVLWLVIGWIWGALLEVPEIVKTMKFDWPAGMTFAQSLGNALAFATPVAQATWLLPALVLLGAVLAVQDRHQRWLVFAHGLVIYLYMLAAGSDEKISNELTGFWYNDQYRVAALLPVTGVPLLAIGMVGARDALVRAFAAWHDNRPHSDAQRMRRSPADSIPWQWAIGLVTIALMITLLPGRLGAENSVNTVRDGYYPNKADQWLVDPPERELYAKYLRPQPGDTKTVIGDPWTGGALAGPVGGRVSVYGHLTNLLDPDRTLLQQHFRDIAVSPKVCAAARRLNIGYAVEDTRHFWPGDPRSFQYYGLWRLWEHKGLTKLGSEGTVTVYRVDPCKAS